MPHASGFWGNTAGRMLFEENVRAACLRFWENTCRPHAFGVEENLAGRMPSHVKNVQAACEENVQAACVHVCVFLGYCSVDWSKRSIGMQWLRLL